MLKASITAGSYTSGNVPMTSAMNTNNKYDIQNNSISVRVVGLTNVKSNIIVTATGTTTIEYQLYADGVAVDGATAAVTPVSGNTYTLNINDVIKTAPTYNNDFVNLTFALSAACTIVGGDVILEYVR